MPGCVVKSKLSCLSFTVTYRLYYTTVCIIAESGTLFPHRRRRVPSYTARGHRLTEPIIPGEATANTPSLLITDRKTFVHVHVGRLTSTPSELLPLSLGLGSFSINLIGRKGKVCAKTSREKLALPRIRKHPLADI